MSEEHRNYYHVVFNLHDRTGQWRRFIPVNAASFMWRDVECEDLLHLDRAVKLADQFDALVIDKYGRVVYDGVMVAEPETYSSYATFLGNLPEPSEFDENARQL